ncbi:trehalose 6-phosphate phosphatase [Angulomicrobium tetraedrale]|uniref:Trehalose 6-phosphate phosphatase n=1 Tax=Ancylobacter tetraedralis TaxID=217068 RepID=A0A839ZBE3_9HYPH|nr:trehalose-phosphatase [Ancylobacter tetraedralis]MBB3772083.1 trehalose 6-phosphate phosphatase [Ancylobacter tetraedralis]
MQPLPRADWALFLDIDGTLIEHADHPEGITIPADLPDLLTRLQQVLNGAVALVSGRTIDWMDQRFAPVRLSASGQHGAEIRLAPDAPAVPIPIPKWRQPLEEALAREMEPWPGVFIEHKPLSLAVHFRAVSDHGDAIMARVIELGRGLDGSVEFLKGRFVIEVRQGGHHKGTAVNTFMNSALFAGRQPVFVGDDVTDEDGFRAVRAMGGLAVAIGPRATEQADFRIDTPAEVRRWLANIPPMLERLAS